MTLEAWVGAARGVGQQAARATLACVMPATCATVQTARGQWP